MMHRGRYFRKTSDGGVDCELCPHRCHLESAQTGICKVRRNLGGNLVLPYNGCLSAIAIDPIEKKPLYHFLPGSEVFSLGFLGCNLHCPFCQNYHISQTAEASFRRYTPEDLVQQARDSDCPSIAYTYSEPLVHIEYVSECMILARERGLKNVLVTNGCINKEPAREILGSTDAVNVDLKSWSPEWYKKELGGDLAAVCAFIRAAVNASIHVEVTNLVIPGKNDSDEEITGIATFLAGISPKIPLHLTAYRPMFKYSIRPTSGESLRHLAKVAGEFLETVHLGNV